MREKDKYYERSGSKNLTVSEHKEEDLFKMEPGRGYKRLEQYGIDAHRKEKFNSLGCGS